MSTLCFLITANLIALCIGFGLDVIWGDPRSKWHPVCLIGNWISYLEKRLYQNNAVSGIALTLLSVAVPVTLITVLLFFAYHLSPVLYLIASSLIIYFGISMKSLKEHAEAVLNALIQKDFAGAANKLGMMVSRDITGMDEEKIITSTIESVSENYTDGVLSPIFFAAFFGAPGITFFKVISTLDSMIGYQNDKYILFGRFSAKTDDQLNFFPARFSIIPIYAAATRIKLDTIGCLSCFWRDRLKHDSPNSAHSMSSFAGALGIALGGPTHYEGCLKDKPYMGDPLESPDLLHLSNAIKLMKTASVVALMVICLSVYGLMLLIPC